MYQLHVFWAELQLPLTYFLTIILQVIYFPLVIARARLQEKSGKIVYKHKLQTKTKINIKVLCNISLSSKIIRYPWYKNDIT